MITACGLTTGGTTTKLFRKLEASGFIMPCIPFGKNANESVYKLSEEYPLFCLKFIKGTRIPEAGAWLRKAHPPSYKRRCGVAFEPVCLKHVMQIEQALGPGGKRCTNKPVD